MKKLIVVLVILLLILLGWFYYQNGLDEENCVSPNSELCETSATSVFDSEPIPPLVHKLCPPDGPVDDQSLTFSKTIDDSSTPGVFQSFGNILNQGGELFSIRVSGRSKSAIEKYIDEVKVCIDYLPLLDKTIASENYSDDMSSGLLQDVLTLREDNLVIEIDLLGLLKEGQDLRAMRKLLSVDNNIVRSRSFFTEGRTTVVELIGPLSNNFSPVYDQLIVSHNIDFIIDPTISSGGWHDYRSHCLRWAKGTVTISNAEGSGMVIGNLYKSGRFYKAATVGKGSSRTLEHDSGKHKKSTYDFGVRGKARGSKYKITGTWNRSYNSARPSGGGVRCR